MTIGERLQSVLGRVGNEGSESNVTLETYRNLGSSGFNHLVRTSM